MLVPLPMDQARMPSAFYAAAPHPEYNTRTQKYLVS
jgi:hypothetical protein